MHRAIVFTRDHTWFAKLKSELFPAIDATMRTSLRQIATADALQSDLVLLDTELLPQPESEEINALRKLLKGRRIVAVYTDSCPLSLSRMRSAFIIGATAVLERHAIKDAAIQVLIQARGSRPVPVTFEYGVRR